MGFHYPEEVKQEIMPPPLWPSICNRYERTACVAGGNICLWVFKPQTLWALNPHFDPNMESWYSWRRGCEICVPSIVKALVTVPVMWSCLWLHRWLKTSHEPRSDQPSTLLMETISFTSSRTGFHFLSEQEWNDRNFTLAVRFWCRPLLNFPFSVGLSQV